MRKKILAGIMAVVMSVTMMPGNMMEKAGVKKGAEAAVTLQNPRIVTDSSMTAGQKVTYDCVWFGSYPQTEIVDIASSCGTYGKDWAQNSDYEENRSLYTSLKNASRWDSNGDVTLNGTKYRRIKTSDATYNTAAIYGKALANGFYYWNSRDVYHYFRYEPIKWRVLDVKNNQVLLLADKGLDNQRYNTTSRDITWKTSTIRSWLNGYNAYVNTCAIDYTSENFINSAFSPEERGAIDSTYLENKNTGPYSENYGGDNTTDKVFLLSSYDVYYTASSTSYGFYLADAVKDDEARRSESSTYAKAMGAIASTSASCFGNCTWWLRSPGSSASSAAYVGPLGHVYSNGNNVYDNPYIAARPAINLNLSSSDLYSYAGTVCTDGTVKEEGGGDLIVKKNQMITASNKTIAINSKPVSLGAKTNGNGKLTYKSSNTKVATVSSSGTITVKGYGITNITLNAAETSTYKKTSKTVTITVVPKKMKLKSVKSPGKGKLQIKWAKNKAASSYQIQFSRDWKFNSKKSKVYAKTISKKLTALKKPVTGLTSKKKYYVRIRALKKVSGKTLQGVWSATKEIKIK